MKEINVLEIPLDASAEKALSIINTGQTVFEDKDLSPKAIQHGETKFEFVPYGEDNNRPAEIVELMRKDEVLSSNMQYRILSGYGTGLKYTRENGTKTDDPEVKRFFNFNRPSKYLLEQMTDMEHFFWSVAVIILSGDGEKIVRLLHKEVCYTRFEKNDEHGRINHIFYKNWDDPEQNEPEKIALLDMDNPLYDLMVRMGREPGADGEKKKSEIRKFAIVNKIPIPGQKYYPFPYWWAIFNSGLYDIKQMIVPAKKAKFKNGLAVNYQVEVHKDYWKQLYENEGITDPKKQLERKNLEQENIKNFLTGLHQAGKVMFSGFYTTHDGKEQKMVRINTIDRTKEGGDWIEDFEIVQGASCYAFGLNPNLVGVALGKNRSSFSGSDKRELFTIHQVMRISINKILLEPYFVIKEYNGWDLKVEIPVMLLTTLDRKTDAVVVEPIEQIEENQTKE